MRVCMCVPTRGVHVYVFVLLSLILSPLRYVLSRVSRGAFAHVKIHQQPSGQFQLNNNPNLFPSLQALVQHYQANPLPSDNIRLVSSAPDSSV